MAQADQTIQNATFPTVRADINNNLAALFSDNSGNTAPSVTVAFQDWIDTSGTDPLWKKRNAANNAWITIATIDGNEILFSGTSTLPDQSGNSGKYLSTDGTAASWGDIFASTAEAAGTHTTGSVTSGSTTLTVASATGLITGMYVIGEGIAPGTTVSNISGTTITLSGNAGSTLSSDPVGFYISNKALSPGLVAGQLCRAWVNFDGTNNNIRASYNVSSITDNGTGDYTVNFATAMPDANYAIIVTAKRGSLNEALVGSQSATAAPAAGSCRIITGNGSFTLSDGEYVNAAIFR